jgi:hypothetical protein
MTDPQTWFIKTQEELAERVGEPVLVVIRVVYNDWFEVEIHTFTSRFGTAADRNLEQAIEWAVVMLLEMDKVIAEYRPTEEDAILAF